MCTLAVSVFQAETATNGLRQNRLLRKQTTSRKCIEIYWHSLEPLRAPFDSVSSPTVSNTIQYVTSQPEFDVARITAGRKWV